MIKRNDNYSIKTAQNGYILSHDWREAKSDDATGFDYTYMEEKHLFLNWADMAKWITDNVIEIPPK